MNRYKWFEQRRQEYTKTHKGVLANSRAFIEYCKSKMKQSTWEKYKSILDPKEAHLPHHKQSNYDPNKAKFIRSKWALDRYEFMYGPLKCKHCGATTGPIFDKLRNKTAIRILVRHDFCSESCSKKCEGARTKREATNLKKYGVTNVSFSPKIIKKIRAKMLDPNLMQKRNAKSRATIIQKYGSLKRYNKLMAKKRLPTVQKRYGGNAPTCSPIVKEKVKQTVLARYGVTNVSKSPRIHDKILESLKKTFSGKIHGKYFHRLRGFEPKFLKWALRNTSITIDEIQGNCVYVKYQYKGKEHTYYPDFVIPRRGIIIEVKSVATSGMYNLVKYYDYECNRAKAKAVVDLGFHYAFAIHSERKKSWFIWKGKLPTQEEFVTAFEAWELL